MRRLWVLVNQFNDLKAVSKYIFKILIDFPEMIFSMSIPVIFQNQF